MNVDIIALTESGEIGATLGTLTYEDDAVPVPGDILTDLPSGENYQVSIKGENFGFAASARLYVTRLGKGKVFPTSGIIG
jgi:hypothetical protein